MEVSRPKILAIDDIPSNLMVLASALSGEFTFQLASSGIAGIAMAEAAPPDLILLDIMMPEMDGYETCRRLKLNPALTGIPVIFVTALTDGVSELSGLELGAADYLHKPIHIDIARQRIRNLIERETLRREVEQHRNRLEDLVTARTVELVHARDAAEVGNRVKSAFLTNISHDLRTPLGVILGMNNLLNMKLTDPAHKDKCNKIARAGNQLLSMIEDILQVSQMESDRAEPGSYAFAPETLLHLAIARHSASAGAKGLDLQIEIDPRVPKLMAGAPTRIKQILERFLSNAIKFSDQGVIHLRIVQESQTKDACQVRFEVEDQGIGIDPLHRSKLFQAFSPVDDSITRRHEGLGIGLALSKHLADTMHGTMGVDSVPGKGSRFWVSLRLSQNGSVDTDPALGSVPLESSGSLAENAMQLSPASAERRAAAQRLGALLSAGDVQAISVWEESHAVLAPQLGPRLAAFSKAMTDFEFEGAHAVLQEALGGRAELISNT